MIKNSCRKNFSQLGKSNATCQYFRQLNKQLFHNSPKLYLPVFCNHSFAKVLLCQNYALYDNRANGLPDPLLPVSSAPALPGICLPQPCDVELLPVPV